jgi:transcriptional regulator with XRE-family HTH domain
MRKRIMPLQWGSATPWERRLGADLIEDDGGGRAAFMVESRSGSDGRSGTHPEQMTEATWWQYVETVTGRATQKDIATATEIDQSSISRWQRGSNTPRAEAVVALARAYGHSPVEALVAAGYLSSDELGVVELTTLTGDLTGASNDSLLSELRRRLVAANGGQMHSWPTGWSSDDPGVGGPQDPEQTSDLGG